jgi:hypothetical protein
LPSDLVQYTLKVVIHVSVREPHDSDAKLPQPFGTPMVRGFVLWAKVRVPIDLDREVMFVCKEIDYESIDWVLAPEADAVELPVTQSRP